MKHFLLNHKFELALSIFIVIYIGYFTLASFLRYENYYTGRFDLGNMAQTVWNTSHGEIFQLTNPNGTEEVSRLAFHADFILILLTPFYMIWSDPKVLLLVQSIVLGVGAYFVFLISKEILKDKKSSLIISIIYLLYPALQYTNLYDFHGVTLATTFLLAAFYFYLKKKHTYLIIALLLAGLTKENVWAINSLFGLLLIFKERKVILGSFIFTISIALFYFLVWHAIPQALGGEHFALVYYSDFGSTPSGVVKNILFSPIKTIHTLFGNAQLEYIKQIFLPLGYLSFLAPIYLIFTAPTFLIDLLSNNPQLHQIYYQYSSTITPFVFISLIFALKLLIAKFKDIPLRAWIIVTFILTITSAYSYGPLPMALHPNTDMFYKPLSNKKVVDNYLSSIPANASIASTNNLGSHLSEREKIYTIPLGTDRSDYVLFLLSEGEFNLAEQKASLNKMRQNKDYVLAFSNNNFFAFKRIK